MKPKLLFIILIFCSFCEKPLSQDVNDAIFESKALEFFRFVSDRKFENASQLFHFPESYSKQELDKDKELVCGVLELVTTELGQIGYYKKVTSWPANYHIGVSGGSAAYWKQHPYQVRLNFEVNYEKEGSGHIFFYFNKTQSTWELSRVDYGIPVSKKESKIRTLTIMRKIQQLIQRKEESSRENI